MFSFFRSDLHSVKIILNYGLHCSDGDSHFRMLSIVQVTKKNTGHSQTLRKPWRTSLTISFISRWNSCVLCFSERTNQSTVISSRPHFPSVHPPFTSTGYLTYLQAFPWEKSLLRAAKIPLTEKLPMIVLRTPSAVLLSCSGCHFTPLCYRY